MKVKLKNMTCGYIDDLFVAHPFDKEKPDVDNKHRLQIYIPKNHQNAKAVLQELDAAINTELKAKFEDRAGAMKKAFKADGDNYCLYDGDEKLNKKGEPSMPGYYVLKTKRDPKDGAPGIFDNRAGADGKPAKLENTGRLYSGCLINASVDIWVQKGSKYQGVRCTLLGVQYAGEGTPFGKSRPASADEFESLVDEADMASASSVDDDFGDLG